MRALLLCLLLALALMPAPHAAALGPVDLRIMEILPDPDTTNGQREFVEVWNAGNATIELQGWKLRDAPTTSGSTNTYTFPAWSLRPNARVVVWGGGAADGRGPAWSNSAVWNNAGDGVSLLDATGALVDWAGYGTTTPPAGFESHLSGKPDKGLSTEFQDGAWVAHAPSPGAAPGASVGTLAVQVANVAPRAGFDGLPASARPGTTLSLQPVVADDNGDADIKAWNLTSAGAIVARGSGAPTAVTLTVPATGTTWTLVVQAVDAAGLTAQATATLPLRSSDLSVSMPPTGLAFPEVAPGAAGAVAAEAVVLQNLGASPLRPLVDVSDFTGPATIPAVGHLELGTGPAGNATWVPYTGALTQLPALAPGESASLWFRLVQLPVPLPAGSYGTSFTVVAG
ncbi:MAG TPA: lamin tail domain-containing protein [Candidatus Thermoplasmatota archaeon]|nr:lamin tail domain-containing protein [Candidatus Thermoplasmatota archaeon]